MKLDKDIFEELDKVGKEAGRINSKIEKRVEEVLKLICKAFGQSTSKLNWWFPNAEEGDVGTIEVDGDNFYVYIEGFGYDTLATSQWYYQDSIPTDFLFMDDKKILEQLTEEIRADKAAEEAKAAHQKSLKEARAKAKKEVMAKLTPEECKLLGIKSK